MQMPTSKVTDGALAGALVTVVLAVVDRVWGFSLDVSEQGALIILAMVAVSYFFKERRA